MNQNIFDELRPYYDSEINSAMLRITNSRYFHQLADYLFPEIDENALKNKLQSINTIRDFQGEIMTSVIDRITDKTIDCITVDGLSNIDPDKQYLFIANHRDIMLDSGLFNNVLFKNGFKTAEITFGSNLMQEELIIDIGKSNKMFKVKRGGTPKEFYKNSSDLSWYIRKTIKEKKESVWIAQRSGRTKNGIDITEQGLIRMIGMSGSKNVIENLGELNIVPVSISYQFETCDSLKARELFLSKTGKYIKAPGEDINSILTGINEHKGNVHITICQPVSNDELRSLASTQNDFYLNVARLIDARIYSGFKLWNTNWIAESILAGTIYFEKFTEDEYNSFIDRMNKKLSIFEEHSAELTEIFLSIYANPVKYCNLY